MSYTPVLEEYQGSPTYRLDPYQVKAVPKNDAPAIVMIDVHDHVFTAVSLNS
jgi:hypothetical protein